MRRLLISARPHRPNYLSTVGLSRGDQCRRVQGLEEEQCVHMLHVYMGQRLYIWMCVCVHMFVCMGSCECEPSPVSEDVVCWEQQSVTNCWRSRPAFKLCVCMCVCMCVCVCAFLVIVEWFAPAKPWMAHLTLHLPRDLLNKDLMVLILIRPPHARDSHAPRWHQTSAVLHLGVCVRVHLKKKKKVQTYICIMI